MSPLDTLFRKDYSYSHENEVRAVIELDVDADGNHIQKLPITLSEIIDYVVVSPYSKDYFMREVQILMKKANLDPRLTYRSRVIDERNKLTFEKEGKYIIRKEPVEF